MSIFRDLAGAEISLESVRDLISVDHDYEVFIGTDSQIHRKIKKVIYVTCIVLHKKGKGGRIFLAKEAERYANSLKERLQKEVWKSLEVSFELQKILPKNVELVVHIDINPKKKFKSSNYIEEFVGMVVSQGFKCAVKPDAFAAQACANRFTK